MYLRTAAAGTSFPFLAETPSERSAQPSDAEYRAYVAGDLGGLAPEHRARRRQAGRRLRVDGTGVLREARDWRILARRRDALLCWGLVDRANTLLNQCRDRRVQITLGVNCTDDDF
jgi:hypothetical protein